MKRIVVREINISEELELKVKEYARKEGIRLPHAYGKILCKGIKEIEQV